MAADDKQLAFSIFAWLFNVSTSVIIVFVNKVLMGVSGFHFSFGAVSFCSTTVELLVVRKALCIIQVPV
jgi:hypothetical protein